MLRKLIILMVGALWASTAHPQELAARRSVKPMLLTFEVNWEILRSGFNSTLDAALEADTYGESWTLHVVNPYEIYLSTPRAKVRVLGLKVQSSQPEPFFDTLVLSEKDFAQLLGIQVDALEPFDGKQIFIELPVIYNDPQTFVLKANPQYFVSVTLNMQL